MANYSIRGGYGFSYSLPGQPFIEEAIINSIITFNYTTWENGIPRYGEIHSSRVSIVFLLIAIESIVKASLHLKDLNIKSRQRILREICNPDRDINNGYHLWEELLKVRDALVHGHLYYLENGMYTPSKSTQQFAHNKSKMKFINPTNYTTKNWALNINPSKVGKYECICAITLWEWLIQNIDNEIKGIIPTRETTGVVWGDDRIVNLRGLDKWLNIKKLDWYLYHNGRIDEFIALLFSKLSKYHRQEFRKNYTLLLNEDIEEIRMLQEANPEPSK